MSDASGIRTVFAAELENVFAEIKKLQEPLARVEIPSPSNLADLWLLIQKIGRILGTLAAAGYSGYAPLAGKAAFIASACRSNRGKSVHVLISQLDAIVSLCRTSFADRDPAAAFTDRLVEVEEKIDFCMKLAGLDDPLRGDVSVEASTDLKEGGESKPIVPDPRPKDTPVKEPVRAVFDDDMMAFFMRESRNLLKELKALGDSLKATRIPDDAEAQKLTEFGQKLNRLIGGTAAMGFGRFVPLSRKTSLLAARCAQVRDKTIRVLILNLNSVVSVLAEGFKNAASLKAVETRLPGIEERIDICMSAVDIDHPEIKTQDEIDDMLKPYGVDR